MFIVYFSRLSYLFLKCTSLLLKSCYSEVIDDIHHGPVCRVWWPPFSMELQNKIPIRIAVRAERAPRPWRAARSLGLLGAGQSQLIATGAQTPQYMLQDQNHSCVSWVQKIIALTGPVCFLYKPLI